MTGGNAPGGEIFATLRNRRIQIAERVHVHRFCLYFVFIGRNEMYPTKSFELRDM